MYLPIVFFLSSILKSMNCFYRLNLFWIFSTAVISETSEELIKEGRIYTILLLLTDTSPFGLNPITR